ncbi:hypothetical protein LOTGIDRAFT_239374 [Lottia gigantea]|uniref:Sushi domain-containing protein n=1 Tax=Lottia gigantea TaxID=225164 RepID=V4AQN0_LOTGI|nr:hypothetical protein LOTGIDRAFT_239374 [Lottia gigantea]ESO95986.1 hypothetical protein LOTGIDRAFT_239374 [Lottia gigantea]
MSRIHILLLLVWNGVERVKSECPVLFIPNAIISSANNSLTEFRTECETGYYRTSGDTQRTCINGIWSGTDIVCDELAKGALETRHMFGTSQAARGVGVARAVNEHLPIISRVVSEQSMETDTQSDGTLDLMSTISSVSSGEA